MTGEVNYDRWTGEGGEYRCNELGQVMVDVNEGMDR